jgi:hypothetical protein
LQLLYFNKEYFVNIFHENILTVAARRSEMIEASTAGIIPGDRGKGGGSWCRGPLRTAQAELQRHISPVPLAGVVSGQFTHESGTERRGAIRNRARAESGPRTVSIRAPTQLPQRVLVATVQTRTQSRFPAGQPRQKASLAARARRAREQRPRGASGPGKVRETSSKGRSRKTWSPRCKRESNLRVKRSDP